MSNDLAEQVPAKLEQCESEMSQKDLKLRPTAK